MFDYRVLFPVLKSILSSELEIKFNLASEKDNELVIKTNVDKVPQKQSPRGILTYQMTLPLWLYCANSERALNFCQSIEKAINGLNFALSEREKLPENVVEWKVESYFLADRIKNNLEQWIITTSLIIQGEKFQNSV